MELLVTIIGATTIIEETIKGIVEARQIFQWKR